ncbi:MAG: tRNA lysidine(34) synthetase TilS [Candidatus Omnitrophota bacterium]
MSLIKKARESIKRHGLLRKKDKVVVGVSGGPDSTALIFVLNSLRREFSLDLHIAHLDHRLRKDSYQDRKFVEAFAKRLNLPFSWARVDIRKLATKGSVEEKAREARLKFLFEVAKNVRADKIALGHNQDDQAETVLMRLIRGAGLYGLGSILPKRKIGSWIIIRPLIEVPRNNIETYLKRRKFKPRIDSSNTDIAYFRNRIRHRLIPELIKEYNPNIKSVLANLAGVVALDYDYLQEAAEKNFRRLSTRLVRGKGVRLSLDKFLRLHPAVQRLILRFSIAQIKGTIRRISFKHVSEIEDLILSRPVNSIVDLPQGVCVLKDKKYLCIYLRQ